jgi:hypothetical protein
LSSCSSSGDNNGKGPPIDLPLAIGNGVGSEHGNYAAQREGETRGEAGECCVIFNWDRPLTKELALRLKSASCESKERPGWMLPHEISRTIIPIGQSNLKDEATDGEVGSEEDAGRSDRPDSGGLPP